MSTLSEPQGEDKRSIQATLSLVLAVLSTIFILLTLVLDPDAATFLLCPSPVAGLLAMLLGVRARRLDEKGRKWATAGTLVGALGLLVSALWIGSVALAPGP